MNSIFSALSSLQKLPNLFNSWAKQSYEVFNDWDKELQNSAEKEHLQTTIPPNFQDLKTTRTRPSARASQILQAKDILQTPAFNT